MLKNPFNYIGGKYKLLPQIFEVFPKDINNFYDIFGGGGEVSLNVNANKIFYFDKNKQLVNIFQNLNNEFINDVKNTIIKFNLNKINKNEYLELREYYNTKFYNTLNYESAIILYTLICHSFNNFIGFNAKSYFNVPFGMNRSTFNNSLEEKLLKYIEYINNNNISFQYKDFRDIEINKMKKNDFVYMDPPYLITTGSYERSHDLKWNEDLENTLYQFIKELKFNKIPFALSNVLENKGKENIWLKDFIKKEKLDYKVLDINYNNCNYQCKNKNTKTKEVIIFG